MSGKVVIVTGANTGIGYEVTKTLCEAGCDVIMACRSEEKTTKAIDKLKLKLPTATASYMNLDLANLESVRKFVADFHASGKKLNILVNNAGLSLNFKDTKKQYTKDNFELTMGTNHLGHFLLTNLLLDDLKKTASGEDGEARIVVVTSSVHDPESMKKRFGNIQPLDLDNIFLFSDGTFNGVQAYKNSKAANLMFTYELNRRLEGSNVKVNAVCPGFVPTTEFMRNANKTHKFFCRYILRFTKVTRTVQQAATAIVSLATDEKYKEISGKYFRDGQEAKSTEETLDETKQKKLWDLSGGYTRLEGYEPIEVPPPPVVEEVKPEKPVEANGDAVKTNEEEKQKEGTTEVKEEKKEEETKKEEVEEPKKETEEKKEVPQENHTETPASVPEVEEKSKEDVVEEKKEAEKEAEVVVEVKEEEKKEETKVVDENETSDKPAEVTASKEE